MDECMNECMNYDRRETERERGKETERERDRERERERKREEGSKHVVGFPFVDTYITLFPVCAMRGRECQGKE